MQILVYFSCPGCRAIYQATQRHISVKRFGRYQCPQCRADVHMWRDNYDFSGWSLQPGLSGTFTERVSPIPATRALTAKI
jgi:hypothetical protein